ncbi:hypothetical protein LCGC14_0607730 [marine sediment metagenome]|uniref:Uncharacterized protein n=1 Tax=marine sediment metagenome TaxID=412755 RepID=A0A0F9TUX0_9ZZZZ
MTDKQDLQEPRGLAADIKVFNKAIDDLKTAIAEKFKQDRDTILRIFRRIAAFMCAPR